jgi:hypothetical protein
MRIDIFSIFIDLTICVKRSVERSQLDWMRTICYQPGPLVMPDLSEFVHLLDKQKGKEVSLAG